MRIILFSDSHPAGPPTGWAAFFDKRVVGIFNHHFIRKHRHNQRWVAAMVKYVLANPPDLVVCAGDISTSGEPSELKISVEMLAPLADDPRFRFVFVPGNHDCYVNDPACVEAVERAFHRLNGGAFKLDQLPAAFTHGGVDFCMVNENSPRNLFLSTGDITPASRDFILSWASGPKPRPKALLGHYPLTEAHPLLRCRHRLYGEKEVLAALRRGDIDLSLCGHTHIPFAQLDPRGRGEVRAPSITRCGRVAQIDYDPERDIFSYHNLDISGGLEP